MKFPYGISDFKKVNTQGYYYCDRTDKIPLLEKSDFQLFIRPRRFGKSLVLSMLENYYDVAKKDEFESIFGNLKIGENPTDLRNSYFILKFDFSCVDPTGSAEEVKKALFNHINGCIEEFYAFYKYKGYELPQIKVNFDDALYSLKSLVSSVRMTPYPVYLLIDEYDNFANTVMMGVQSTGKRYEALVHDEGPLRTFFKAVKSSTSGSMFDKVFITGVSPVVMSDITSGYNIAENIYFEPEFNDLCGFKQNEIEDVLKEIVDKCGFEKEKIQEAVNLMQTYYNGYTFSHATDEHVYNPTLSLYFFKQFEKTCSYPRKMLDSNLAVDESKLEYIAQISRGRDLLMNLVQKDQGVVISDIEDRFGIKDMLTDKSRDNTFSISFLYYFGVLTIAGDTRVYIKLDDKTEFLHVATTSLNHYQYSIPENVVTLAWKVVAEYKGVTYESQVKTVQISALASPDITALTVVDNHTDNPGVKIEFDNIFDINEYLIVRKDDSGNTVELGITAQSTYIDSTVSYDHEYEYRIKSKSGNTLGADGGARSVFIDIKPVTQLSFKNKNYGVLESNSLVLSYVPAGENLYEKYEILIGTNPQVMTQLQITQGRSVDIDDLAYNTTYYAHIYILDYEDKRISNKPFQLVFTTSADTDPITEKPLVTYITNALDQIVLSWSDVPHAEKYHIFRSENGEEHRNYKRNKLFGL